MHDHVAQDSRASAPNAIPSSAVETPTPRPPVVVSGSAPIFELYPRGSAVEVLGALRFLIGIEGVTARRLEAGARLEPGAVDTILSGQHHVSSDVVGHLCVTLRIPRWLFFLIGSIQYGADLGIPELRGLIEERRRMVAETADDDLVEFIAEATRVFFKLGGQREFAFGAHTASRRWAAAASGRLVQRQVKSASMLRGGPRRQLGSGSRRASASS